MNDMQKTLKWSDRGAREQSCYCYSGIFLRCSPVLGFKIMRQALIWVLRKSGPLNSDLLLLLLRNLINKVRPLSALKPSTLAQLFGNKFAAATCHHNLLRSTLPEN